MADLALPLDEMLTGLRDIRLPVDAPGGLMAEIIVMLGFGALLALGVALALRMITTQRPPRSGHAPDLNTQIKTLRALPEDQRAMALLHLIRQRAQGDALPAGLYTQGGIPNSETLETILLGGGPANA